MTEVSRAQIESAIEKLEAGIRQLKVQYDMFFAGALPSEPYELRTSIERMIKRYSNAPIRKYAHRFHFNALVSRFNSLSELWTKTLRTMEEGERPVPGAVDRTPTSEQILTTCRVQDPIKEHELLRLLHARFLEARRKLGGNGSRVSFDTFLRGIDAQAKNIRQKAGCEKVELRLVVTDRKVHLKARPGK